MTINYNSPIIFHRNVDESSNPVSIPISNEPLVVFHNKSYLQQIPDKYWRVTISGMVEIDIDTPITEINQYKVTYGMDRLIYFHQSKEGQTINVSYYGVGYTFIPADNICTQLDSEGEVTETLKDVLAVSAIIYKIPVTYFSQITTTYPNPEVGWSVQTTSDNKVYRWDGVSWNFIYILGKGDKGDAATIAVGTVTTGNAGTSAIVTNSGTTSDAVFNFTIPRGNVGNTGATGKGYVPKNAWVTATAYVNSTTQIDTVSYNGSTYYCILSHTSSASILPTNTTYWGLLAQKGTDGAGSGDMLKVTYDPSSKNADAFNTDNHVSGTTNKVYTAAEQTKLAAISGTNTGNETTTTIGALINGATAKTAPVDADYILLMDSAASNITKKLSWAYIKSAISSALATTFAALSHTHGNITNAGAIGTTTTLPIITGTSGVLQAGSFGTTSGTFCQGNDSRLSDSRTPVAHSQTASTITDFDSTVLSGVLAGLSTASTTVVTATHTILQAIGFLQGQITSLGTTKANLASPTFTGTVTAPTNTAYTTRQVRNVVLSTSNATGGSNGDIWFKYTV